MARRRRRRVSTFASFIDRRRIHQMVRPGVGIVVAGRRGGFFKKLFKKVGKVVKFVAPAVVAVAKTAAKHTVAGKIVTAVGKLKKRVPSAARTGVKATMPGGFSAWVDSAKKKDAFAREAKSQGLTKRRAKRPRRVTKRRSGKVSAKQAAARQRFAAAARRGRIKRGARL